MANWKLFFVCKIIVHIFIGTIRYIFGIYKYIQSLFYLCIVLRLPLICWRGIRRFEIDIYFIIVWQIYLLHIYIIIHSPSEISLGIAKWGNHFRTFIDSSTTYCSYFTFYFRSSVFSCIIKISANFVCTYYPRGIHELIIMCILFRENM